MLQFGLVPVESVCANKEQIHVQVLSGFEFRSLPLGDLMILV